MGFADNGERERDDGSAAMRSYSECGVCASVGELLCPPCPAWSRDALASFPTIWVGGGRQPISTGAGFGFVISCDEGVAEHNPPPSGVEHMLVLFEDAEAPPADLLDAAAIALERSWETQTPALVRCYEGLNRAPLVIAWWLSRYRGVSASQAVDELVMLRSRPGWYPLSNESFTRLLEA